VDLLDVDSLVAAYIGLDAVALQLPLVFDDTAVAQARNVLTALEKAGVRRVVFNQSAAAPPAPIGVPYVDARVLIATELQNIVETTAIVAPAATYAENLTAPWSLPLIAAGSLRYPLPTEAPTPWVATADVAAVIAEHLTAEAPPTLQLIAGPEDLTGAQTAAALGPSVRWETITPSAYEDLMRPYLGAPAAAGIAASYANPAPTPDPTLIRRGTTTLKDWAAAQSWTV
jgi:hypothetical protein